MFASDTAWRPSSVWLFNKNLLLKLWVRQKTCDCKFSTIRQMLKRIQMSVCHLSSYWTNYWWQLIASHQSAHPRRKMFLWPWPLQPWPWNLISSRPICCNSQCKFCFKCIQFRSFWLVPSSQDIHGRYCLTLNLDLITLKLSSVSFGPCSE